MNSLPEEYGNYQRGDDWKNFKYNFSPKPKPYHAGAAVKAFNGASIGKGHLAEAKDALQKAGLTREGADSEFYIRQMQGSTPANGGASSQRNELLAKIKDANKVEAKTE